MAPSLLNVTNERSLACSTSDGVENLHCYGEEDVMQAWTNFLELERSNSTVPTEAVACLELEHSNDASSDDPIMSYPEMMSMDENSRFPGKVVDGPPPFLLSSPPGFAFNMNVPSPAPIFYNAYGVATASLSDQANSLPQSLRGAATMANFMDTHDFNVLTNFWSDLFPK
eukprot:scaffold11012_cov102-Skeletonema_menzelii.AAC.2